MSFFTVYPRSNAYVENDNIVIETELAGYNKNDVKVSLSNGVITILAKSEERETNPERKYLLCERKSEYKRTFTVRKDLTKEEVSVTYSDGLLRISFPETGEKTETDSFIEIQ